MPGHEVDSVNDVRPHAATLTVEYAHTEQGHLLRHAERSTADYAGDVRTVSVAVNAGAFRVNGVENCEGTLAKFKVRREDAGIDNIGVHALTIVLRCIVTIERQR